MGQPVGGAAAGGAHRQDLPRDLLQAGDTPGIQRAAKVSYRKRGLQLHCHALASNMEVTVAPQTHTLWHRVASILYGTHISTLTLSLLLPPP